MPATYEPIASTTLGSSAADFTFSAIPGTFTDLVVVSQSPSAIGVNNWGIRFNADTGNNYSCTQLYGTGSAAASTRLSNVSYSWAGANGGGVETSIVQIMSYANTNVFKTILVAGGSASNYLDRTVGLWRSTSAITSLTLWGGTFPANTRFSLYGIKAAA